MIWPILAIDITAISEDATLLASVAIILGTVFVVIEMRDNKKLVAVSVKQANTAALQLQQNHELATVDLITRLYDFANSLEVQRSWFTVVNAKLSSYDEYDKLPKEDKLAFQQIASLFESVGLLVEKGFVKAELADEMFATGLAWESLEPFVRGIREKYKSEEYYTWMEKLHNHLSQGPGIA